MEVPHTDCPVRGIVRRPEHIELPAFLVGLSATLTPGEGLDLEILWKWRPFIFGTARLEKGLDVRVPDGYADGGGAPVVRRRPLLDDDRCAAVAKALRRTGHEGARPLDVRRLQFGLKRKLQQRKRISFGI
ncbi:hypothetical protein AVEN_153190-1 [Araneus ventricosus]|uniref:Uncharacterized protein n=1 Tax=Araneus ventricosus TaxID=182803 RepID=A0A4Y2U0K6_ARAVE|nr:hypothetical protein AVEN_179689-1 [Araneus ventricosus]GBO06519.1 hypothetical protein AVEN_153190-1 [Araneus ventricosus]